MLGEEVGWVSKIAFFILKNKVKIRTVWPFHSYIPSADQRATWGLARSWVSACPQQLVEARDAPSS